VGCALWSDDICFFNSAVSFFNIRFTCPSLAVDEPNMEKVEFEWDKEQRFEIEKVPLVYLITALCVVPFAIYFLLNFLSPLIHRITAMRISEVCLHFFCGDEGGVLILR